MRRRRWALANGGGGGGGKKQRQATEGRPTASCTLPTASRKTAKHDELLLRRAESHAAGRLELGGGLDEAAETLEIAPGRQGTPRTRNTQPMRRRRHGEHGQHCHHHSWCAGVDAPINRSRLDLHPVALSVRTCACACCLLQSIELPCCANKQPLPQAELEQRTGGRDEACSSEVAGGQPRRALHSWGSQSSSVASVSRPPSTKRLK